MRRQRIETNQTQQKTDETTRIAEEIVSVLPGGVARACSADRDSLRFSVRGEGIKLRTIVLRRASLQRLADDADRAIKVEYLQRDLLDSAGKRTEFRYPRLAHFIPLRMKTFGLPMASVV